MFGAIEAGGTKLVCGIGTGPDDLSERIIMGGGIMQHPHVFGLVRREVSAILNGYPYPDSPDRKKI